MMFLDIDKKEGDRIAIVDDSGNKANYKDLQEFSKTFSEVVPKRTIIFILAENSYPALASVLASISNRIVPLLLSANINQSLLDNLIKIYQPEYIWVPKYNYLAETNKFCFEFLNYGLIRTKYSTPKLNENLSMLIPTSGSTGSSKLVRHSYENLSFSAENVARFFDLDKNEKGIALLPLHYTMGLSVITSHLYAGATVLLTESALTEKRFWDFIKENQASSFTGVPFSFEILNKLRFFRMDLPHLKTISQGGGRLRDSLFADFADYAKRTGKRFIATYGQTEGTARMAFLPPELAITKTGSIGNAIPNGRLAIIDQDDKEITQSEATGEMVYYGKNVTMGYAEHLDDLLKGDERKGFLKTGDLVKRDKDNCYYIVGRLSRFLKLYGLRVSLDEIESMVKNEFNIECVCTGSDEKMIIYMTQSDNVQVIKNFIIQQTGIFPHAIEVKMINKIPRNESGKILYNELN